MRIQKEEICRENSYCLREYIYHHGQNVAREMNGKDTSGEISGINEEHVIGNWKEENPYSQVAENGAGFSFVGWEVELTSDEPRCLADEIPMQSVERVA